MPGYVIHMAVASRIIGEKGIDDSSFINAFLLGNIVPDAMDRALKKESHFWDDGTYKKLNRIPNIDNFLKEYGHRMEEPYVLGYYTHLLLDYYFVKEYWSQHFKLLDKDMNACEAYEKVTHIRLDKDDVIYPREEFLSDKLYYGDYDRINPYIFDRYPYIRIEDFKLDGMNIDQIDEEVAEDNLRAMVSKINRLYDCRDSLDKQPLKVFDLEHIFSLMDRVVSDVCER